MPQAVILDPSVAFASFKRDANGLFPGRTYHFTLEGAVDYKRMVDPKYLYVADQHKDKVVKQFGKPLDQIDITEVPDKWLRITLGGINQLANLRGYTRLVYHTLIVADGRASIVCEMDFIGNYESGGVPVTCSGVAAASPASLDKDFRPYMETFAENRAFTRCVKRALQINITSDIEIGGDGKELDKENQSDEGATNAKQPSGFEPCHSLENLCATHQPPITFVALKARATKEFAANVTSYTEDPATWTSFESIKGADAWSLMGKIKAAIKTTETKAKK